MIEGLPQSINSLFLITVILTIFLFWLANKSSKKITLLLIGWSLIQCIVASSGFYHDTESFPPHFLVAIIPPFLLVWLGVYRKQKLPIDNSNCFLFSTLTHSIRLPVELTLFYLFQYGMVPELMTFEGRNFDILAGITAPFISWFYTKRKISNRILLYWNIISLLLVLFVLVNGILSARLPIQILALDNPTIGLEYAPFVLLPSLIVPVVVYTHIIDIIKLLHIIKKK